MRLSIRWKWMIAYLLIVGSILLFMALYLNARLQSYFYQRFVDNWQRELLLAKEYVAAKDLQNLTMAEADRLAGAIGKILHIRVSLIERGGRVVGDSEVDFDELLELEDQSRYPEILQAKEDGFGKSTRFSLIENLDLVYLAAQVGNISDPKGFVRIAVPVSDVEESLAEINQLIWLAAGLGFVLVVIIGFFVSNHTIRRLQEMTEAAKRFARGNFGGKIRLSEQDELSDLGAALNHMSEDLEKNLNKIIHERDKMQAILNNMVEGVLVTDSAGNILLVNRSFQKIFQLASPFEHTALKDVIRNVPLLTAIERAMVSWQDRIEEIEVMTPQRKQLEAHITVMGSKLSPGGAVVVFHDITQIKHLEQVRSDFVANVSHELQTPLTAIKGYAETLFENGKLSKQQSREFLQIILRHTDRMSKLVKDLLILSRLESEEFRSHPERVQLQNLIMQAVKSYDGLKTESEVNLNLHIPENLPPVLGVGSDVETVLHNLIDNAFKYGASGKEITIQAKESGSAVQVDVIDKGMGIPSQDQGRIFERFYRVDKGRSRALGGTGLGLAIVKHIIQKLGGQVWVQSELGRGATFSFTLPKAQN
jgi:two-component system phosphate regulon sensor histidine kinase PhoR